MIYTRGPAQLRYAALARIQVAPQPAVAAAVDHSEARPHAREDDTGRPSGHSSAWPCNFHKNGALAPWEVGSANRACPGSSAPAFGCAPARPLPRGHATTPHHPPRMHPAVRDILGGRTRSRRRARSSSACTGPARSRACSSRSTAPRAPGRCGRYARTDAPRAHEDARDYTNYGTQLERLTAPAASCPSQHAYSEPATVMPAAPAPARP
jgi:hypothetical protein